MEQRVGKYAEYLPTKINIASHCKVVRPYSIKHRLDTNMPPLQSG